MNIVCVMDKFSETLMKNNLHSGDFIPARQLLSYFDNLDSNQLYIYHNLIRWTLAQFKQPIEEIDAVQQLHIELTLYKG